MTIKTLASTSCAGRCKRRFARSLKTPVLKAPSWSASCLSRSRKNFGFDAQEEEYVDMIEAGIIDPVKVVRIALQDAASVAGLLITTEAMVADKPQDAAASPAMPDMGGMGGMGGMM